MSLTRKCIDCNNLFVLLAGILAPQTDEACLVRFKKIILSEPGTFQKLLDVAVLHNCLPFLYVQLRHHGLYDQVSEQGQQYLKKHYLANFVRNEILAQELQTIVVTLQQEGVRTILLKGAATLADNLFGVHGVRFMEDLDLFVNKTEAQKARTTLLQKGYVESTDAGLKPDGLPTDNRFHHLHPLVNPKTKVAVELHYRLGSGLIGDLYPGNSIWEACSQASVEKTAVNILAPTARLAHNTASSLLAEARFIRGDLPLLQLFEFGYLAQQYRDQIFWLDWIERGTSIKQRPGFLAYLELANQLLGTPWPREIARRNQGIFHLKRVVAANSRPEEKSLISILLLKVYYFLKLPGFIWENVCYTGEKRHFFVRVQFFVKKVFSSRSWGKL